MAKVRLEIMNENDEKVVYEKNNIKGSALRKAFQTMKKAEKVSDDLEKQMDLLLDFTVDLFADKKLTADKILDGLDSEEVFPTLNKIVGCVIGVDDTADPNAKK